MNLTLKQPTGKVIYANLLSGVMVLLVLVALYAFNFDKRSLFLGLIPFFFTSFLIGRLASKKWFYLFQVFNSLLASTIVLGLKLGLLLFGEVALTVLFLLTIKPKWLLYLGLIILACILIVVRMKWFIMPRVELLLPIYASMFMFRIFMFLNERERIPESRNFLIVLHYFYLLPNIGLILFPIVGFKDMVQGKTNKTDPSSVFLGVKWLIYGLTAVLLERIIYQLDPISGINENLSEVTFFCLISFLSIFKLIGYFFIASGLIALQGFTIPTPFSFPFLSSNFQELWSRINIYWALFIQKIVYYPLYFKWRKRYKDIYLIPFVIFASFTATYFLHQYQLFWFTSRFPLDWKDVVFWYTFAIFFTLTFLVQQGKSNNKPKKLNNDFIKSLYTLFTLLAMSFLWVIWTSPSFSVWLHKITSIHVSFNDLLKLIGILVLSYLILYLYRKWHQLFEMDKLFSTTTIKKHFLFWNIVVVSIVSIFLIGQIKSIPGHHFFKAVTHDVLNKSDRASLENSYYESILGVNNLTSRLWEFEVNGAVDWQPLLYEDFITKTNDERLFTLNPNYNGIFKGAKFSVNDLGCRDKNYSLSKDSNKTRIVVLGGSHEMGSGVNDNEVFENLLEGELNVLLDNKIEIINLSVGGYQIYQTLYAYKNQGFKYNPDIALYFVHPGDRKRCSDRVAYMFEEKMILQDDYIKKIANQNSVKNSDLNRSEYRKLLEKHGSDLFQDGLIKLNEELKISNTRLVLVYLPLPEQILEDGEKDYFMSVAKANNLQLIDLSNVYNGYYPSELIISVRDGHPNKLAHQLIAAALKWEILKIIAQGHFQ